MKILEHLGKRVTVRPGPEANGYIGELPPGHQLEVEETPYLDLYFMDVAHTWYKIIEGPYAGWYVNAVYPPNGARYKEIKPLPEDKADYYILHGYLEDGTQVSETRLERME